MVPLTAGFLLAAPISGMLADRYGARPFTTGGLLIVIATFVFLLMLPVDFSYWTFAGIIFLNTIGMGAFLAPNQTGIMNSLPASQRGAGAGIAGTFNWSAQVLSTGIFFSLMIVGLASRLPSALYRSLVTQGVSPAVALQESHLSPVGSLFAAFLGYNPMKTVLGSSTLSHLSPATANYLTGRTFFPRLVAQPFSHGLDDAFIFAAVVCLFAAVASLLRGGKFHYQDSVEVSVETQDQPLVSVKTAVDETEPLLGDA